jgi:hypothetical protein
MRYYITLFIVLLFLLSKDLFSQNVYWRGTVSSNWNVGLNWVGNVVPNNKNAIIDPDDEPYLGVSYYRLKQTDFDGKYKYSNTVSMINSLSDITIINTSNGIITILYNNNQNDISSIEIYNTLGYKVYYSNTYHQSTIDISNQKNGIYIVRCNLLNNKSITQKILKTN